MKAIKINGLKLELVDMDYNFLKEQINEFNKKGKKQNAEILNKLINALDEEKNKGKEITQDLIEKIVNKIIDENTNLQKQLKSQIKAIETENKILSQYSKRETDNDTTAITIISSLL